MLLATLRFESELNPNPFSPSPDTQIWITLERRYCRYLYRFDLSSFALNAILKSAPLVGPLTYSEMEKVALSRPQPRAESPLTVARLPPCLGDQPPDHQQPRHSNRLDLPLSAWSGFYPPLLSPLGGRKGSHPRQKIAFGGGLFCAVDWLHGAPFLLNAFLNRLLKPWFTVALRCTDNQGFSMRFYWIGTSEGALMLILPIYWDNDEKKAITFELEGLTARLKL
jgi:hypothetical protein